MSPILVFVYNRPYHTAETLKALSLNLGADKSDVIIYSDGPKSENDAPAVNDVRQICRNASGFGSVSLIERPRNMGLADNIISAVSVEIRKYGSVIVLEDDLITSEGFINYMNEALEFYRDSDIFSICGYSPGIDIPESYRYSTYLTSRIGSWGWASWVGKWELVDWELNDFKEFIQNKKTRKNFESGGNDLAIMLLRQKTGRINSWAVRFAYACFKYGNRAVYPVYSLIRNTGIDGSGTHMKKSDKYVSTTVDSISRESFCPVDFINPEIQKNFRNFYSTSVLRRVINFFKLNGFLSKMTFTGLFK